jgi:hypothetical protein
MRCVSFTRFVKSPSHNIKDTEMVPFSLRLPADILAVATNMGDHVRGGTSEVLRRAVALGLPKLTKSTHFFTSAVVKSSHQAVS